MVIKPEQPVSAFLLLGTHGSGLSTALDHFADYGYITIANLQPKQLKAVLPDWLEQPQQAVAFSLFIGGDIDPNQCVEDIQQLKTQYPRLKIFTLDAPESVLVQRYLCSEKKHPLESIQEAGLQAAVALQKKLYEPIKALKDYSIDTSTTTAEELKHKIGRILGHPIQNQRFTVYINTFGFKYGIPSDAELVFDMRFMTNPFYDETLRPLTGLDAPIKEFIFNLDHAQRFFEKWSDLVAEMLPLYQSQGKTRLSIAVGCTGGKHRSVCMGEALAEELRKRFPDYLVLTTHREQSKWQSAAGEAAASSCGQAISSGAG